MKRVEVVWHDANRHTYNEWTPITDLDMPRLALVNSIGYLVHQDQHTITLVQQWNRSEEAVGDGIDIPRSCVQTITLLQPDTTELT